MRRIYFSSSRIRLNVNRFSYNFCLLGSAPFQPAKVRQPRRLIFQVARVSFIDCATARLIAGTEAWLPPGVKPVIAYPPPLVRRVFEVSGLAARCELQSRGPR